MEYDRALAQRWVNNLPALRVVAPVPDAEADDEVLEILYDGDDLNRAWTVITEIVRLAPDEDLVYVGAGPLETLLREHGDQLAELVEAAAATDLRFRTALSSVITHGRITDIATKYFGDRTRPL